MTETAPTMTLPEELLMLTGMQQRDRGYTDSVMRSAAKEIERLRIDAARYLWLNEDADRCAQVVADAYDTWDTDVHWDEHFDAAITHQMEQNQRYSLEQRVESLEQEVAELRRLLLPLDRPSVVNQGEQP